MDRVYFRAQVGRYVRFSAQLINQVVRHAFFQGIASANKGHLACVVGKMERGLTGRVAGADKVDVESMNDAHFAARGAIVDTLADKPIEAIDREASPRHASGKNEGSCPDDVVTIEKHFARRWIDARDRARDKNFRPKPPRLLKCATGKFVARDVLLEESEMEVLECNSAETAVSVLDRIGESVWFLFTDENLAGTMSGAALAAKAKGRFPQMDVVVTSSSLPPELPGDAKFCQNPGDHWTCCARSSA